MSYKIAVSKSGSNVLTATDPNDFIFHSDYNTFKIISTGTLSQDVAGPTTTTLSVAHGLDYTPLVYAFMKADSNNEVISPRYMFLQTGIYYNVGFDLVSADSTYIYFQIRQFDASTVTIKIRYYIFETPF